MIFSKLLNRKIDKGVIKFIVNMNITTIPISRKFHDWLKGKGMKGESYEDVIKKLLRSELLQELEESKESSDESSLV